MVYYFSNNEKTFHINIHLAPDSSSENNQYFFQLHDEKSIMKEGHILSKKIGEEFYYSLDKKNWQRFPKNFAPKQCIGAISFQIFSGFLPSSSRATKGGDGLVISQMPGKISKISVKKGDSIVEGQTLLVMEAMKMENEVKSTTKGLVEEIFVSESQNVESGTQLIKIGKL
jgi:biotin carboxyl carrier protein